MARISPGRNPEKMARCRITFSRNSTAFSAISTSVAFIVGQAPFLAADGVYSRVAGLAGITLSATAISKMELRSQRRWSTREKDEVGDFSSKNACNVLGVKTSIC